MRAHIPQLDGLRAFAVSLVFLGHASNVFVGVPFFTAVLDKYGVAGVQVFFGLSGFLITGILLSAKGKDHYYRNFFVRRGLRVYPLFYAFMAAVIFSGLVHRHGSIIWPYALYVSNLHQMHGPIPFAPLWSLCVEEQFYIIWPLAVLSLSRKHLQWLCVALVIASIGLRFTGVFFWENTIVNMDGLALGALIACRQSELYKCRRLACFVAPLLIFGLGNSAVAHLIQALSSAALLVLVLDERFALNRLFVTQPFRFLGKISYGFYLLHSLILAAFLRTGYVSRVIAGGSVIRSLMVMAGEFLCVVALASASFYAFESPFLKLKDRFTITTRSAVGSAATTSV